MPSFRQEDSTYDYEQQSLNPTFGSLTQHSVNFRYKLAESPHNRILFFPALSRHHFSTFTGFTIDFTSKVDTLYIFEELEPVIEEQVRAWGIECIGKEAFTVQGEYSANMIRKVVLKQDLKLNEPAQVAGRPPLLCPGCPALTKNADGTITIDQTMCNGCGLCKQICPFDAIEEVARYES